MARYVKLLSLLPRLGSLAMRSDELREIARQHSGRRACQLVVDDESGDALTIWVGVEGDEAVVRQGRYPSTNTLRIHIDAFIDVLKGRLDFRTAVAHGLAEVESHDGLPWFYHFALWASFWDRVASLLTE